MVCSQYLVFGFNFGSVGSLNFSFLSTSASFVSMKITKQRIKQLLIVAQVLIWISIIMATIDLRQPLVQVLWFYIPYIFLINFNWYYLAPRFLQKGTYLRYGFYVLATILGCAIVLTLNGNFANESEMWLIISESGAKYLIPVMLTMSYAVSVVYLLSMPFYLSFGWFEQRSKIDRLESENLRSELSSLKEQINPHFFFNTLNNLYSLTLNNSDKAPEAMLKLSELMRYVIYDANKPFVSIQEEVDYLESYFELQKMRIGEKAKVMFSHSIDDPTTQVVPLLFINLLENAFKHGVDSMVKGGSIECSLTLEKGRLEFNVKNAYESGETNDARVGLANLKRRLTLLYPESHTLTVTDGTNTYYVSLIIEKTDELSHS